MTSPSMRPGPSLASATTLALRGASVHRAIAQSWAYRRLRPLVQPDRGICRGQAVAPQRTGAWFTARRPPQVRHEHCAGPPRKGVIMRLGTSIVLLALGAILTFALNVSVSGVNLDVVGWILMIVGVLGIVLELAIWGPRSRRRVTHSEGYAAPADAPVRRSTTEETY